jgi:hypothetical protein
LRYGRGFSHGCRLPCAIKAVSPTFPAISSQVWTALGHCMSAEIAYNGLFEG